MRELTFAVLLAVAAVLVVVGVAEWSHAAGFVTGGVLLAGWSWLVLSVDTPDPEAT